VDADIKEMFEMILGKLDSIDKRVDSIDKRVTKNSIEIESIQSIIKTIAEIQKAHMDQNERDHEKIIKLIDQQNGLFSAILKNQSTDIRGLEKHQELQEQEISEIKRRIG